MNLLIDQLEYKDEILNDFNCVTKTSLINLDDHLIISNTFGFHCFNTYLFWTLVEETEKVLSHFSCSWVKVLPKSAIINNWIIISDRCYRNDSSVIVEK